jgi:hypothetical protein
MASVGREESGTEDFRQWSAVQLDRHGSQFPAAARQAVVSASSYWLMGTAQKVDRLRIYPSLGEPHAHLEHLSSPRAR